MGGGPEGFVVLVLAATLACIGTPIFAAAALFLTRGVKNGRRKLVITGSLLPIACVAWALSILWVEGTVNQNFFNRDPEYGDMWACPLPDGYALMMIDDPDEGVLYNTKTQSLRNGVAWGSMAEDTVGGVRTLQLAGPYILGGFDNQAYEGARPTQQVDSYFLLDTRTNKHTNFSSYDALENVARQLGIELKLEGILAVYSKYRFTWFEAVMDVMLCVPPLIAVWLFVRRIIRLRSMRSTA